MGSMWIMCFQTFFVLLMIEGFRGGDTTPQALHCQKWRNNCPQDGRHNWANAHYLDRNCFCDNLCQFFGDCCDAVFAFQPHYHVELPGPRNSGPVQRFMQCLPLGDSSSHNEVYQVNQCPRSYDKEDDVKKFCEDKDLSREEVILSLPVSARRSGLVYRNVYCAMCHDEHNVTFWQVETKCHSKSGDEEDSQTEAEMLEHLTRRTGNQGKETNGTASPNLKQILGHFACENKFSPPQYVPKPRHCKADIQHCAPSWEDPHIQQRCYNHTAFVYTEEGLVYKNIFCAMCNHLNTSSLLCKDPRDRKKETHPVYSPAPFTLQLDLNTGSGSIKMGLLGRISRGDTQINGITCADGSVYDPYEEACRAVYCSNGNVLKGNNCIEKKHTASTFSDNSISKNLRCRTTYIGQSDFRVLANGSVLIRTSGKVYHENQYQLHSAGVKVCTNGPLQRAMGVLQETVFEPVLRFEHLLGYLSFSGHLISIVALLTVFIVHIMLKPIRTLTGKCFMTYVGWLILAQIAFVSGMFVEGIYGICIFVGICIQLTYLSSFFWMNALAYDAWRTLNVQFFHKSARHGSQRYTLYTAYATVIPVLLVMGSIGVDMVSGIDQFNMFKPLFGEGLCWINNQPALLLLFALPFALTVFTNVAFFAVSVHYVRTVKTDLANASENIDAKMSQQRLGFYSKIAILMVLTWTSGFVASVTRNILFWYLFIVMNTIQDLFTCLGFFCNSQAPKLLKEKFKSASERGHNTMSSLFPGTQSVEDSTV